MKFITFQPKSVLDTLNKDGVYNAPSNEVLKNKIYALKLDEHTMERIFTCAPSMPQIAIVFNSEDFEEIDSVAWVNELNLGITESLNTKYKEYIFDKIELSSVESTINISDSEDPDEVQDDFMDYHFKSIQKLSGYSWYRLCDVVDSLTEEESSELMYYVELCMMPFMPVTEADYDIWLDLIRKHFIR